MIGVIALLSRPSFLPSVLENFARQSHPDKLLCVVENGPAVGACSAAGLDPDLVVRSEHHRSHARNAGIEALRLAGIEYWAIAEDDDFYGPGYLAEIWENRERADVLGKQSFRLRGDDGSLWQLHPGGEHQFVDILKRPGGLSAATLAGRTEAALPFSPDVPVSEEVIWYLDMLHAGRTLYSLSAEHFELQRFGAPHVHASPGHWSTEVRLARGQLLEQPSH